MAAGLSHHSALRRTGKVTGIGCSRTQRAVWEEACNFLTTKSSFGILPRRYHLPNDMHSCLDSKKHTCNLSHLHGRCMCDHHLKFSVKTGRRNDSS